MAKMREIPDYGELMILSNFVSNVRDGFFIDYDGSGYYATATEMSDEDAIPSVIYAGIINREYTHVVWFNK